MHSTAICFLESNKLSHAHCCRLSVGRCHQHIQTPERQGLHAEYHQQRIEKRTCERNGLRTSSKDTLVNDHTRQTTTSKCICMHNSKSDEGYLCSTAGFASTELRSSTVAFACCAWSAMPLWFNSSGSLASSWTVSASACST